LNSIIKCPNCKVPVEKISGCDSLTCPICKTNFCNSTGKIGGHGGSSLEIKLKQNFIIDYPEIYKKRILNIENNPVFQVKILTSYNKLLSELVSKTIQEENCVKLYGKYKHDYELQRLKIQIMIEIERYHNISNLSNELFDKLDKIIHKIS